MIPDKALAQTFRRSPAPSRFAVLLPFAHFVRSRHLPRYFAETRLRVCSGGFLPFAHFVRYGKTLTKIFRRSPAPSRFAVLLPFAHFVRYGRIDRAPCSDSTLPACPPPPARARLTAAQGTVPLPLLPSGPDGIRGRPFAQGPGLQRHVRGHRPERGKPRQGIRPHWSGLWATGHRYLPV
jgi:hypothetical protein